MPSPHIPDYEEYIRFTPSFESLTLKRISLISLFLAILVDSFTIILSYWLEKNPFGNVTDRDRDRLIERLLEFTQWNLNDHDQLEFRLQKTASERVKGIHDVERLFAASSFLNKGYLRRVDKNTAEFYKEAQKALKTVSELESQQQKESSQWEEQMHNMNDQAITIHLKCRRNSHNDSEIQHIVRDFSLHYDLLVRSFETQEKLNANGHFILALHYRIENKYDDA